MAAPTFVAAGDGDTAVTTGECRPAYPTGWADGDIGILVLWWVGSSAPPADELDAEGWTEWTDLQLRNGTVYNGNLYWRRLATGDNASGPIFSEFTSSLRGARIYGYRGTVDSGDPSDVRSAQQNAASATVATAQITTTVAETLVAFIESYEDDPTTRSLPSGYTAGGTVYTSSTASDSSSSEHHKALSATGSESPSTVVSGGTFANSVSNAYLIALKAPVAGTTVTPTTLALTTAAFAPTVTASNHQSVTPTTKALTTTTFAPTVTASDHQSITPTTASLSLTTFAPTVSSTQHVTVTPTTASLTLAAFAPSVTTTAHQTVTPTTAVLSLTSFAPTVTVASGNQVITPDPLALSLTTFAPTVTGTAATQHRGGPPLGSAVITGSARPRYPRRPVRITPSVARLRLTAFQPSIIINDDAIAMALLLAMDSSSWIATDAGST